MKTKSKRSIYLVVLVVVLYSFWLGGLGGETDFGPHPVGTRHGRRWMANIQHQSRLKFGGTPLVCDKRDAPHRSSPPMFPAELFSRKIISGRSVAVRQPALDGQCVAEKPLARVLLVYVNGYGHGNAEMASWAWGGECCAESK
ncbi:hypothetical protein V8C42DRAFT_307880 [Trichoderma barbatum]